MDERPDQPSPPHLSSGEGHAEDAQDHQPISEDTPEVKKAMKKLGFPQIEGDTAPSAMIPKACAASNKQVEILSSLISTFSTETNMTKLQTQPLV